jgi:hypothetical protein
LRPYSRPARRPPERRRAARTVVALALGAALLACCAPALRAAPAQATPLPIASLSSPTHPDEALWYPDPDPSFLWTATGAVGYSYLLDQTADSVPAAGIMVPALRFSAATLSAGSLPWSVGSGDVTGDGKADLVVADYGADTVSLLAGNGAGGFGAPVAYGTGANPHGVAVADLNGDGTDDVVVADWGDATISVLLARGDGTLRPAVTYAVKNQPSQIAVGDFNHDGALDLAVADYASSVVSVLLGKGDGTFAAATNYATAANAEDVTAGDFNGDGNLDLAVADWSADTVSVLLGKGDGAFASKLDYPVGANPHSVVAADFTGDGALDLAVADWSDNTISVLAGVGDGTFAPATTIGAGFVPADLAVTDFNGDGLADLAVADWGATDSTVGVLLGKGSGAFAAPQTFAVPTNPHGLTVGDFNGDGAPDLAVACNPTGGTSVAVLRDLTRTPLSTAYSGRADGVWYFHVRAVDVAGVAGPTATRAVRIDTVAPTSTLAGADDLWHALPVDLTISAADTAGGSGMSGGQAASEYRIGSGGWHTGSSFTVPAPADHSGDGVTTVSYRSRDAAGNLETARTATVRIDTTGPVVSVSGVSNGAWLDHDAKVALSVTDAAGSGVSSLSYTVDGVEHTVDAPVTAVALTIPAKPDGTHTLTWQARDIAGNLGSPGTFTVRIDTVAPVVVVTGADDRWHRKPVTLRFTATDTSAGGGAGSGVRDTEYSLDGGTTWRKSASATVAAPVGHTGDGVHTVLYRATDLAGNVEIARSCRVKIDTRGPVTAARTASGRAWHPLSLRYRLSDGLSPKLTGVTVVIRNAAGLVVLRVPRGVQSVGVWQTLAWTPRARGVYHFAVYGKDLAGNPQSRAGDASINVR